MLPKVIAVVGPTASGKTALGIFLAQQFNGEVISVDSRLVYRGMDIGTAKPVGVWKTMAPTSNITSLFGGMKYLDVEGVPHWGIDLVQPDEDYSVAEFKTYAEARIAEILSRGHVPILVGGTGLWVRAVLDRLQIPEVPPQLERRKVWEAQSADDLFALYKRLDPDGALLIDRMNKRRLVRALEVSEVTGKPFSSFLKRGKPVYDVCYVGINQEKAVLVVRIEERVNSMVADGLVDEVRKLKKQFGGEIPAMSGIGYRQVCRFLDGKTSLKEAIEDVVRDTKHYAKRQMTWFGADERIRWVHSTEEAQKYVEEWLSTSRAQ